MAKVNTMSKNKVGEEIPASLLLDIYTKMLKIRLFNEREAQEAMRDNIYGFVHLYTGEEAIGVGVISALEKGDKILSTHRAEGHFIAAGVPLKDLTAEIFGRKTGLCQGRGGPMGLVAPDYGMISAAEVVGSGISIATGIALAFKMTNSKNVAVTFFGDGATNQGVLYESMNMAALWKLPVIFVCENNGYAVDTSVKKAFAVDELVSRTTGFGLPGVVVDGTDVVEVYTATKGAAERARKGEGPTFIEARALRICGHHLADPQWYYRSKEEVEKRKRNDPIVRMRTLLLERSIITEADDEKLRESIAAEIEEAMHYAQASPWPEVGDIHKHLYAESM